jgi:hypothetical protein
MKKPVIIVLVIACIICACYAFKGKQTLVKSQRGFALIELFSSEGCSSCPPAERVMHKLMGKADSLQLSVYIIEFHVDYWDYLGWKDTLANNIYTQRQQHYSDFLKLNSIYTPQAVINGKTEMVGSDEDKINETITKELSDSMHTSINCNTSVKNQAIEVDYSVIGNTVECNLNFAIVESGLNVYIKKGENAGKTINHDNVARVFESIKLDSAKGRITLYAPHVNLQRSKLICFVQNRSNMNIIAATQLKIQ